MKNSNRDSPRSKNTLLARSREAAAWRSLPPDIVGKGTPFRSDALRPRRDNAIDASVVEDVVLRRRRQVGTQADGVVSGSRFLVWFPDQTLSDGAAQLATNGYFDADNQPPWDTWLGWISVPTIQDVGLRNMLVAWVPGDLVKLVSAGVDANPEECLQWLGDDGRIQLLGTRQRRLLTDTDATCSWDSAEDAGRSM
jgi:hypothetical protein